MSAKNVLIEVVFVLAIIIFSIFLLFANFNSILFNENFRKNEFNKNNVYSMVPNADGISAELFDYLKSGEGTIQSDVYSEKEKSHLVDVRVLIQKFILIFKIVIFLLITSLILLFFLVGKNKIFYKISLVLLYSSGLVIPIMLLFLILLANFQSSFTSFHLLFFTNLDWMLSPDTILIKMFPQQFFYDFSMRFFVQSVAVSFILLLIGLIGYSHFRKI